MTSATPPDSLLPDTLRTANSRAGIRLAVLVVGAERGLQRQKNRALQTALQSLYPRLEVWNIDIGALARAYCALLSFHPDRTLWQTRFNSHTATFRARTATFRWLCKSKGAGIDAFLQIGATFDTAHHTGGRPVVVYTDYSTQLTANFGRQFRLNLSDSLVRQRVAQEAAALRAVAHICTRSAFVADAITSSYGVARQNLSVVGGGPNLPLSLPDCDAANPDLRLLFVGREFYRKGGDLALRAFERFRATDENAVLHVVTAKEHHRPACGVVWHSALSEADLASLYEQSDICVNASRFETWGDVIIEAMTTGAACICPDLSPMNEIVGNEIEGLCVAPEDPEALADAMERLARCPELRMRLGAAARAKAMRQYTWAGVTEKIAHRIDAAVGQWGNP